MSLSLAAVTCWLGWIFTRPREIEIAKSWEFTLRWHCELLWPQTTRRVLCQLHTVNSNTKCLKGWKKDCKAQLFELCNICFLHPFCVPHQVEFSTKFKSQSLAQKGITIIRVTFCKNNGRHLWNLLALRDSCARLPTKRPNLVVNHFQSLASVHQMISFKWAFTVSNTYRGFA